jgi:flagellar hook-associated protein 3 FlgL
MLRLSDLNRSKTIIHNMNNHRVLLDRSQQEVSTGKRMLTVADDPGDYTTLLRFKDAQTLTRGFIKNIQLTRNDLDIYESLLGQTVLNMREVKTLTIQASNGALYQDNKESIKLRLENIMESLITIANNATKGEYMFAGSKVTQPPFEVIRGADGIQSVIYKGDNLPKNYTIDATESVTLNLSGESIFTGPAGMGQGLFDELLAIKQDLQDDRFHNADEHITKINTILDRVINKQGELGSVSQHLDRLEDFMNTYHFVLQEKSSRIENVDMAAAVSTMLNQEHALRATLEVAARLNNLSLLNFMK